MRSGVGKETVCTLDFAESKMSVDRNHSDGWSKGISESILYLQDKKELDIHIFSDQKMCIRDRPMGLLNQFLQAIGLDGMVTSWLAEVSTALTAVSIPEGWRFTGMYMVIFYAALVSLDPSVYEAAKVDGASEIGARI